MQVCHQHYWLHIKRPNCSKTTSCFPPLSWNYPPWLQQAHLYSQWALWQPEEPAGSLPAGQPVGMQLWHPLLALLAPVAAEPDLIQGCEMHLPSSPAGPNHCLSDRRWDHLHMPVLVLQSGSPLSALSRHPPFPPGYLGYLHHCLPAEISENDRWSPEHHPRSTPECRHLGIFFKKPLQQWLTSQDWRPSSPLSDAVPRSCGLWHPEGTIQCSI